LDITFIDLFFGFLINLYPLSHTQMKTLKDSNKRMKRLIQQRNSVRMSMSLSYDNFSFTKEQLNMLEERDQTIGDLQFSLDERTAQLEEVRDI
jgi:septation ring formation regulator EzrA